MVSTGELARSDKPLDPVPTERNYAVNAIKAASRLSPFWLEVADSLKASNVSIQAGQNTNTPDGKAIIGPYLDIEGLFLSVGHSGHGVMGALEGGRLLTTLVTGEASDQENPFSWSRFAEEKTLLKEELMLRSDY
jgi:glycine/D-amino acid oxidase-like deaminating enzyme